MVSMDVRSDLYWRIAEEIGQGLLRRRTLPILNLKLQVQVEVQIYLNILTYIDI